MAETWRFRTALTTERSTTGNRSEKRSGGYGKDASKTAAEADVANGFGAFNKPEFYDKELGMEDALRQRTEPLYFKPGELVQMWEEPVERFTVTRALPVLSNIKGAAGYAFGYPIEFWRVKFLSGDLKAQVHNVQDMGGKPKYRG